MNCIKATIIVVVWREAKGRNSVEHRGGVVVWRCSCTDVWLYESLVRF
jgi:hypothetical protein